MTCLRKWCWRNSSVDAGSSPRCPDPAVSDFDEPFAQEISSCFEQVGTKAAERRIVGFEEGGEGVHHGSLPVSAAMKKRPFY